MSVLSHRLFYAGLALGFAADGTSAFIQAQGVQSMGISVNFNLQFISELGKLPVYDTIEQVNEVEINFEKVIDGAPLIYHLLTQGAVGASLVGRSNVKSIMALTTYPDTNLVASGTALGQAVASGLIFSNVAYAATVDGNATETVTGVGNNLAWTDLTSSGNPIFSGSLGLNSRAPSGVKQRRSVVFTPAATSPAASLDVNGYTSAYQTVVPNVITGVSSSGTIPLNTDGNLAVPIQSINISANLSRDNIFALGSFLPWFKVATFPVTVTTEINVNTNQTLNASVNTNVNRGFHTIRLRWDDGTMVDVGQNNKLASYNTSGGSTSGDNLTTRFSFENLSEMTVTSPSDPSSIQPIGGSGF